MSRTESSPEPERSLRAAHRARHSAAAPEVYPAVEPSRWAPYADDARVGRPVSRPPVDGSDPDRDSDDGSDPQAVPPSDLLDGEGETRAVAQAAAAASVADALGFPVSKPNRAGRNLPAAIAVGGLLAAVVVASLLVYKPAFYVVVLLAVVVGTWEMVRAVAGTGPRPPLVPLLLGGPAIVGLAWYGGAAALPYGLIGTAIAVLVWRLGDGPEGYQRDIVPALLIAVYVPFLGSFTVLLANPDDGALRVLVTLVAVALSDTGGYAFGVFLGKHPMARSVSPKKSWEGFAGSVLAAAVGSAVLLTLLLDGAAWWHGAVFGLAVAAAATLGDLAESLLKRDLNVKDMSSLLPGHGGLMDRLDSILLAAPVGYAVLTLLVPPG